MIFVTLLYKSNLLHHTIMKDALLYLGVRTDDMIKHVVDDGKKKTCISDLNNCDNISSFLYF